VTSASRPLARLPAEKVAHDKGAGVSMLYWRQVLSPSAAGAEPPERAPHQPSVANNRFGLHRRAWSAIFTYPVRSAAATVFWVA
jgi:hypothetical protein